MRKIVLIHLLLIWAASSYAGQKPDWVQARPTHPMCYIGIGMAKKSAPNYMQEAKKQALSDLASEIKVVVSSQSLLQEVEKDNVYSSYFKQSIETNAREELEAFELTESWSDDHEYWVYYRLDKEEYQRITTKRKEKAAREGYSFWSAGNQSLAEGDLYTAIGLYIQGMEHVQPYAHEALVCLHNKTSIHIGLELYRSLTGIFNGITFNPASAEYTIKAMQMLHERFDFVVSREGIPLKNIRLKAAYSSGSGVISLNNHTGSDGMGHLSIQNVTSKAPHQEILISIDPQPFLQFQNPLYHEALRRFTSSPPQCPIRLDVEQEEMTAFVNTLGDVDQALNKSVKSFLSRNHFTLSADESGADLLIYLKSSIRKGGKVKGDMADFIEYFSDVQIQVIRKKDHKELVVYSVNDLRSLSPESASEQAARSSAAKAVLRKVEKEFKKELENMRLE